MYQLLTEDEFWEAVICIAIDKRHKATAKIFIGRKVFEYSSYGENGVCKSVFLDEHYQNYVADYKNERLVVEPVKIMPESIWVENRIEVLINYFQRYLGTGEAIPPGWISEYNRHCEYLKNRKKHIEINLLPPDLYPVTGEQSKKLSEAMSVSKDVIKDIGKNTPSYFPEITDEFTAKSIAEHNLNSPLDADKK